MVKKLIKIALFLAVVLFLCLIGAYFFIKSHINKKEFRDQVSSTLEEKIHRKVTYEKVGFSIFPLSLQFVDFKVGSKDGEGTFIGLDLLDVKVDLKTRAIKRIVFNAPQVAVTQYHDGSFNFSDLIVSTGSKASEEPEIAKEEKIEEKKTEKEDKTIQQVASPVDFNIELIEVADAKLLFKQEVKKGEWKEFSIPDFDLQVRNISLNHPISTDLNVKIGKMSHVQLAVGLSPLKVVPPDVTNMNLDIKGEVNLGDFKDLELFLTKDQLNSLPIREFNLTWAGKGSLNSEFVFNSHIKTPQVSKENPLFIDLKKTVKVKVPEEVFQGILDGKMVPVAAPRSNEEIDLQGILPQFVFDYFKDIVFSTEVKTPRLSYEENNIEEIDIGLALKEGCLNLEPLGMKLFGGEVKGKATVEPLSYPLHYKLDSFSLNSLDFQKVVQSNQKYLEKVPSVNDIQGLFSMDFNVEGKGITELNLRENLFCRGEFLLKDGKKAKGGDDFLYSILSQLDHPQIKAQLPGLAKKIEQMKASKEAAKDVEIKDLIIAFNMEKSLLTLTRFEVGMPDYFLRVTGTVKPFDSQLDLLGDIIFSEEFTNDITEGKDQSDWIPYENKGIKIPLKIKGSFEQISYRANTELIVKNLAKGKLKDEASKGLEKLFGKKEASSEASKEEATKKGKEKLGGLLGKKKLGGLFGK